MNGRNEYIKNMHWKENDHIRGALLGEWMPSSLVLTSSCTNLLYSSPSQTKNTVGHTILPPMPTLIPQGFLSCGCAFWATWWFLPTVTVVYRSASLLVPAFQDCIVRPDLLDVNKSRSWYCLGRKLRWCLLHGFGPDINCTSEAVDYNYSESFFGVQFEFYFYHLKNKANRLVLWSQFSHL